MAAGALAWARTAPLTSYVVGTAALAAEALLVAPGTLTPYVNLLGVYLLGLYGSRTHALWGPVVLLAGIAAYFAGGRPAAAGVPVGVVAVWLLAWAFAYRTARRGEERDAARLALRDEAVAEERARIAQELHDLLGHTLTVMVVQAGAGRVVLDTEPARARALLETIESTGREAMDELDRLLSALGEQAADPPGMADLPRLVARLAEAGVAVRLDVAPGADDVPRSLHSSAYRIVQEALTNALNHGAASSAIVRVARVGGALTLEVVDDGRAPHAYAPGRGLIGIAERAAVLGGSVEHGPTAAGGFRVSASLPVPERVG
nr:histidine kinase [Modestobacter marinus]